MEYRCLHCIPSPLPFILPALPVNLDRLELDAIYSCLKMILSFRLIANICETHLGRAEEVRIECAMQDVLDRDADRVGHAISQEIIQDPGVEDPYLKRT